MSSPSDLSKIFRTSSLSTFVTHFCWQWCHQCCFNAVLFMHLSTARIIQGPHYQSFKPTSRTISTSYLIWPTTFRSFYCSWYWTGKLNYIYVQFCQFPKDIERSFILWQGSIQETNFLSTLIECLESLYFFFPIE